MNARGATTLTLALLAATGLACGDETTGLLTRVHPTLVLADTALVVTALDTPVRLQARSGGKPVTPKQLTFALVHETPYLADRSVFDPAELAAGVLVPRFPGEAIVAVAAPGTRRTAVRLTVTPPAPAVLEVIVPTRVGPDSVVTLRGYRLHDPAVLPTVRGRAIQALFRDSTTLTLRPFEADTTDASCGTPARALLDLAGAALRLGMETPNLRFERPDELDIAPGEAVYLTREQLENCVRLPAPNPGTDKTLYAFVTVDTAWTLPGYELATPYAAPSPVAVAVTRLSDPAGTPRVPSLPFGASRTASDAGLSASERVGRAPVDSDGAGLRYMHREVPLAIADTFTTVQTDLGIDLSPRPARVLDVVEDYVVVAAWDDLGADELDALEPHIPMVRQAVEIFLERAEAMYQDVFGMGRPRTLHRHEQVVLIIESRVANASAQRLMIIPMGGEARSELEGFYLTFAHELAHLYHLQHRDDPGGGPASLWKTWNIEGIADYMMAHAGAAFRGLDYLPEKAPILEDAIYRGLRGRGNWSCGYSGTAALLRRFDAALIESGVSPAEARRRVVRAAMAGWGPGDADGDPTGGVACGLRCLIVQAYGDTGIGDILLKLYLDDLVNDAFAHPLYNNPTTFNPAGLFEGRPLDNRTWGTSLRPSGAGVNITLPDVDGGAYRLTKGRANDSERWAVFRVPDGALQDRSMP